MTKTKPETFIKYIIKSNKNIYSVRITSIDPVTFSNNITCVEADYKLRNISLNHKVHSVFYYTKGKRSIEHVMGNIYYI